MDRTQAEPSKVIAIDGLVRDWAFHSDPYPRWRRRQVLETLVRNGRRRPAWSVLKPLTPKSRWMVYFMYAPTGAILPSHRFTLSRLRDMGGNVLVVCATSDPRLVPEELKSFADAIFWKALDGYDFSAYTLALRQISQDSEGADVFVMNDSIFGPFVDLSTGMDHAPWELTGYSASSQIVHHVQSYAFFLKNVTRARMRKLATVFLPFAALSNPVHVIAVQELRFARIASRSMSVGAFWFGDAEKVKDPSLHRPIELLDAGFPFLKKSLLGKHKAKWHSNETILEALHDRGHPTEGL